MYILILYRKIIYIVTNHSIHQESIEEYIIQMYESV